MKAGGLSDDRVVFDESATVLTDEVDVLGYYSWGSNDPAIRRRKFNLSFRPGAIGGMFVSTDGRTFKEPPADWKLPARWEDKKAWFAGTPQSLAGDLIREGITGVAGHVAEPLLGNTIRPDILFPAYVAGFSLAEAYYLAMPSVSWMTVVVGDPLCAPFATPDMRTRGSSPIDPATELPVALQPASLGAARRDPYRRPRPNGCCYEQKADWHETTGRALVPIWNKQPSWRQACWARSSSLRRNTTPTATSMRRLPGIDDLIELSPDSALALNNLAYILAIRKGSLGEALPLAERAHSLMPRSGVIADTLGWIYFMSGNSGQALPIMREGRDAVSQGRRDTRAPGAGLQRKRPR